MEGNSWYFSDETLRRSSPSRLDGVSEEQEKSYRRKTCFYIDEAGRAMTMPKLTVATAHVFFHRFFARQSFKQHDRFMIAAACLLLAGKVEESPKKLQSLVTIACNVRKRNPQNLDRDSTEYAQYKEKILMCERILLHTIGFDMCVEHPYKYLIEICKRLKNQGLIGAKANDEDGGGRAFAQTALNFVNDSMRTSLCLQFPPAKVAAAAVYLATMFREIRPDLRGGQNWMRLLMVPSSGSNQKPQDLVSFDQDISVICKQIMELYQSTRSEKYREAFSRMAKELHMRQPMFAPRGDPLLLQSQPQDLGPLFSPSPNSQPSPSPARSHPTPSPAHSASVEDMRNEDARNQPNAENGISRSSNLGFPPSGRQDGLKSNGRSRADTPVEEAQISESGESGGHPSNIPLTRPPKGAGALPHPSPPLGQGGMPAVTSQQDLLHHHSKGPLPTQLPVHKRSTETIHTDHQLAKRSRIEP